MSVRKGQTPALLSLVRLDAQGLPAWIGKSIIRAGKTFIKSRRVTLRLHATEATRRAAGCRKIWEGAQIGQPRELKESWKNFILDVYDDPHVTIRVYIIPALNKSKLAIQYRRQFFVACGARRKAEYH